MTCIVGVTQGKRVYFGADSCLDTGDTWEPVVQSKIWISPVGWLGGYAGDYYVGSRLTHTLELPKPPMKDSDLDRWAILEIPGAVELALRGMPTNSDENDNKPELSMMIGLRGRIYIFTLPSEVIRCPWNYASIGSGSAVALGNLCDSGKLVPKLRLQKALSAAAKHVSSVRRPFLYLNSP